MSWPLVKLTEVAEVNPRCPKDIDEDQIVSFVAMASASEAGLLLGEELKVLKDTKKGFTYFERGDVLLAKITPCFENGKTLRPYQIKNQVGFGSTEFHVVRADLEKLDPTYLFYLLWSDAFRFLGTNAMAGAAGQKRVGTPFLKQLEIPLPPLDEQKRIAAILDKADAIRQKRKQAIDLADEFLRSVFLDMFGDPNDESSQRELISFGKLGGNENNKRIPLKQSDRDLREGEYPYYGATGVIDYVDDYVFDGDYLLIAEDGKNLVNRTKPLAFPANGKFWVNNHSHVIRNTGTVDLVYLEFYLNLKDIRKYVTGIDQFKLNRKSLDSMPIYLPDMELQRKFSSLVKLTLSSSGKMLNGLELLGEQFNSLSQKAFSGQL
ncbi:TPA: restriction endonuclease subunit S [Vibrio parahaemolyticus]|nr:restriction endonuclease subunit S [Vibrio parahaemolyticus]HDM8234153.1 restriction endonuclease subunit S [Vibrio campbellii]